MTRWWIEGFRDFPFTSPTPTCIYVAIWLIGFWILFALEYKINNAQLCPTVTTMYL